MDIHKKIINNDYVFSVLTRIYLILAGVIISSLQVRFLGKDLNGELAYINSSTNILNTVFVCGIHQSYVYYRRQRGDKFRDYYMGSVTILFGIYIAISVMLQLIIRPDFDIAVIVLTVPILFYIKIVRYVTLVEYPKTKNEVEIIMNTSKILFLAVVFFFVKATHIWILVLLLFQELLSLVLYLRKLGVRMIIDKDSLRLLWMLLSFGVFPMLSLLLTTLNYRIDVVMLKTAVTYASVSIYTIGVQIGEQCWAIPDAIRDILMSKLTNGKTAAEVCKVIRFSNSIMLMAQIAMIALGNLMIRILYGEGYSESYNILLMIMLSSYGMIYTKMISTYNVAEGKQKINLLYMIFTAGSNIVINFLLIPRLGIYGAGIASVISYNLGGILQIRYFSRLTGTRLSDMLFIGKNDIAELKKILGKNK